MGWSKYDSTGAALEGALTDFPVGSVVSWAADTAPTGWLKCDGTAISRTGYPELFGAIGTNYGTGDGSTTFNLPTSDGEIILAISTTTRLSINTPTQYVTDLPASPQNGQEVYLATPVLSMATPVGLIQHRRYNAAALRWDYVGSTAPYYATALPATPTGTQNGLEVYYAADATNGIIWHLRYNALSSSAYKWEYVGGSPIERTAAGQNLPNNTSEWIDATTVGPKYDVALAGDYLVHAQANGYASLSGLLLSVGVAKGANIPVFSQLADSANAYAYVSVTAFGVVTGATTDIRMRYSQSASNSYISGRRMLITPVRVA